MVRVGLVLGFVVLTGCVGTGIKAQNGMVVRTAGETNLFRPSLSVMEVLRCEQDDTGRYEEIVVDGGKEGCYGRWVPIATVQGTQAGALTGLWSAAIQGGAIVGGAYLLGDGIRDSADRTTVTQEGGGASSNSQSKARSWSRSNSSSRSSASQSQRQTIDNRMMGGRD